MASQVLWKVPITLSGFQKESFFFHDVERNAQKLLEYKLRLHVADKIVKRRDLTAKLVVYINSCGCDTKEESTLEQLPRKYFRKDGG